MPNPQLLFVARDGSTPLPKGALADWNATDHEWGTAATPNPIPPNAQGNWQVLRIKNSSVDANALACKFFLSGAGKDDALALNSGGDVPSQNHGFFINQSSIIKGSHANQGDSYSDGIPLLVGPVGESDNVPVSFTTPDFDDVNGALGTVGNPGTNVAGVACYVDIGTTGIEVTGLSLVLGYAYVP